MGKAAVNTNKTNSSKSHMLFTYANDVDIIGRTMRKVTSEFAKIEKQSAKVGLVLNKDKTKLMVSASRLDQILNVDNRYNF